MKLQNDNTAPGQSVSPLNWLDEAMRSGLIDRDRQMYVTLHRYKKSYGDVAVQEAEIRQKIEIEIAFQDKLVSAFDKDGYFVEDFGASDEREKSSIRGGLENEPWRVIFSWRCFRVHSKDASVPFWLTVWLFSDKATPSRSFKFCTRDWRVLGGDDIGESDSPNAKELEGILFSDATMPRCCHLLVIDERLRFETLPLDVMRDRLLFGPLAEELASKVALAFDRLLTAWNPMIM